MDVTDNAVAWSSLGVPSVITQALLEQNFHTPTAIQTLAIPPAILGRRDILGAAETGSGKTLAFGIPLLNGILELKKKEGRTIVSSSGEFREMNKDETNDDDSDADGDHSDHDESMPEKVLNDSDKNGIGLVRVVDNVELDGFDASAKPKKPLYALILTPTRELAVQIKNHLTKAAKFTDIRVCGMLI